MDIHKIIENAKKFENEDSQFRFLTDQRTKIEDEAYDVKRTLENFQVNFALFGQICTLTENK